VKGGKGRVNEAGKNGKSRKDGRGEIDFASWQNPGYATGWLSCQLTIFSLLLLLTTAGAR